MTSPQCRFKVIGVGQDFRKEAHFPAAVCPQIEVIPFVENRQELQKIYQTISIFVLPSLYESFGLVMAEAMACGCALVASRTGFAAHLEPHVEAMILDEPRAPYLYNSIQELLLDDPLRIKVAARGYQSVQQLRWDGAVNQLEATYLQWLAELRHKTALR